MPPKRETATALFKGFDRSHISKLAATGGRDQKRCRASLEEQYPMWSAEDWNTILPAASIMLLTTAGTNSTLVCKLVDKTQGITAGVEVLFFQYEDGPFFPHLKLLHKYPELLPRHTVDIGGCKYVCSGAKVMCPGLTSAGGKVGPNIPRGHAVGIYIEGKVHAVAVGLSLMSSEEIIEAKAGVCMENLHHLGDGLWLNQVLAH